MTSALALAGIALVGASGLAGACVRRRGPDFADRVASVLVAGGSACAALAAVLALAGRGDERVLATSLPGGDLAVGMDALSALFTLPVAVLTVACSVYALAYYRGVDQPRAAERLRIAYGLASAGLLLVLVARHALLFLLGWELMAIAAFFCVAADDRDPEVRGAAFLYLVCTRGSALCLFALFALFWAATGSLRLEPLAAGSVAEPLASGIAALALLGFGLKAGLVPLHIWLPPAHAAAPTHVSAFLSGVLIKSGIYGLVRVAVLLPDTPVWSGQALLALGVVSSVLGVAYALAQHDVKRLLAYHSIENIGIIAIGLGLAVVARAAGRPETAALALAGALLHVVNHALFKGLLFLGAGAVTLRTHTRSLDALGGVAASMPLTAALFLLGAVAIAGLPPLNGFVSELLIYSGLLRSVATDTGRDWLLAVLAAPALALTGGLALACFAKVVGTVYLGVPRGPAPASGGDAPAPMLAAMLALALLCAAIGLAPHGLAPALGAACASFLGAPVEGLRAPLVSVALLDAGVVALVALAGAALLARIARAPRASGPTWDCGYAAPDARMQYSASSFAELLVHAFSLALRPRVHAPRVRAVFPAAASFHSEVPDVVLDRLVQPGAHGLARWLGRLHALQQGSIHAYLLYLWLALVALLAVTAGSR